MSEQQAMNAVLDELSTEFLNGAYAAALAEGWPEELAETLCVNALPVFLEEIFSEVAAAEAFDTATNHARFLMMEDAFTTAIDNGDSRRDSFLMLLALDPLLAERRGEPGFRYPIAWIDAAVAAVESAADDGQTAADQIIAGFAAFKAAANADVADVGG